LFTTLVQSRQDEVATTLAAAVAEAVTAAPAAVEAAAAAVTPAAAEVTQISNEVEPVQNATSGPERFCKCVKLECNCCRNFALPLLPLLRGSGEFL